MKSALIMVLVALCFAAGCSDDNPAGASSEAATVMITGTLVPVDKIGSDVSVRITLSYESVERVQTRDDRMTFITAPVSIMSTVRNPTISDALDALNDLPMNILYDRAEDSDRTQGYMSMYVDNYNRYQLSWLATYHGRRTLSDAVALDDFFGAGGRLVIRIVVDGEMMDLIADDIAVTVRGVRDVVERSAAATE